MLIPVDLKTTQCPYCLWRSTPVPFENCCPSCHKSTTDFFIFLRGWMPQDPADVLWMVGGHGYVLRIPRRGGWSVLHDLYNRRTGKPPRPDIPVPSHVAHEAIEPGHGLLLILKVNENDRLGLSALGLEGSDADWYSTIS